MLPLERKNRRPGRNGPRYSLLNDQIRTRSKKNLVESRLFSEMLEEAIRQYQNPTIEAAQVIEDLIAVYTASRSADL